MKKTAIFGLVAVFLICVVATTAFAMPFARERMGQSEEMVSALEAGDYDSYMQAMDDSDRPYMAQHLTEEQFQARAENFQQIQERRQEMQQSREQAFEALQDGDYDAWFEAMSSMDPQPAILETINKDNFDSYVELHNARMDWDFDKVKELSEELGIEGEGFGFGQGFGRGKGFGKGINRGLGSGNCPFTQE